MDNNKSLQPCYLSGHHGGLLSWDREQQKVVLKEYFPEGTFVVYQAGQIYLEHQRRRYFLYWDMVKQSLGREPSACLVNIKQYSFYLTLQVGDAYIGALPNGQIKLTSKEQAWEQFQLVPCDQLDNLHTSVQLQREIFRFSPKSASAIPKVIWLYWEQIEVPAMVTACVQRLKRLNPDFKIHFLNLNTVKKFLQGDYLTDVNLSAALRSDLIRLDLLYHYGGIWSDASILFNQPMHQIFNLDHCYELNGFYRRAHFNQVDEYEFPVIETWLLAAPPHTPTIQVWREELQQVLMLGVEELVSRYQQHPQAKLILNSFANPYYFVVYLCQIAAFLKFMQPSFSVYCADHSAFYYHEQYGWECIQKWSELSVLKKENLTYLPNLIKLTRNDRKQLEQLIENKHILPRSYLGHIFSIQA